MRTLLDESVPGRLGALLVGQSVVTVQVRGWASIQNGKLLALAAGEFDVLLTADKGMAHQQNPATLPVSILIVLPRSNRIETWRWPCQPSCQPSQNCHRELCAKLLPNPARAIAWYSSAHRGGSGYRVLVLLTQILLNYTVICSDWSGKQSEKLGLLPRRALLGCSV